MPAKKSTVRTLKPKTILSNFSRYLYARCGLAETTVNNYLSTMRRLFPVLGTHPTARQAEQHIANMRMAGKSSSHQANTSIALERYGDFIHVKIKLGRPKSSYSLVRGTLSEAEMARLIGATHTLREKAILALLAYSGLRNKELCWLRIGDLDMTGQLTVHGTKVEKDRAVAITPSCLALMVEYLLKRSGQPGDAMFLTIRHAHRLQQQDLRKMIRTIALRAGITRRVYPHLVRHSLATNLLTRGSGVLAIKEQLGHVYINTTMRYIHSLPSRLQEEYKMHAPSYL